LLRCLLTINCSVEPIVNPQDFFDLLSNDGQGVMRRLDVVTVKGSEVPIGIYTYDALQDQDFREDKKRERPSLNTMVVVNQAMAGLSSKTPLTPAAALANLSTKSGAPSPAPNQSSKTGAPSPAPSAAAHALGLHSTKGGSPFSSGTSTPQRRPSTQILLPGSEKAPVFLTPDDHTGDVFEQDYDMLTLRKHATDPEFQQLFKEGITAYLDGDWQTARKLLERSDLFMKECAPALGGDGPSRTLLEYMCNQKIESPNTRQGFTQRTSK
jgi:hypothetical protein